MRRDFSSIRVGRREEVESGEEERREEEMRRD